MAAISGKKVVHILEPDKFTLPFIDMVQSEFDSENHLFLCTSEPATILRKKNCNIRFLRNPYRRHLIENSILFFRSVRGASRIILHGNPLLFYFLLFPWLPSKTYWVIYGYEIDDRLIKIKRSLPNRLIRLFVLSRISGHITHIKEDSDYANSHFGSHAKFFYSPIYLSNVIDEKLILSGCNRILTNPIRILVGNNTSPTNNHESIFRMLLPFKDENILLFCPLSYGLYDEYRDMTIAQGRDYFGNRFVAMTEFMKPDTYREFLNEIDIAIFNHQRQEGMGVIIQLLNLGKVIYMNSSTTSYKSFVSRGFRVFDNTLIGVDGLFVERDVSENVSLARTYYSYERLLSSWNTIFDI